MKRAPIWALAVMATAVGGFLACGGNKGEPPKSAAGAGSASVESAAGSAAPTDSAAAAGSAAPSTTLDVGDGGAGTKLSRAEGDGGAPRVAEPGRSHTDIQARVAGHREEIQACYEEGLKQHPGLEGDLVVKWVIDPKGAMTDVGFDTAKTQILDDGVQQCVIAIFKKITFPPSAKGLETRATYPFKLRPKGGAPKKN